MAIKRCNDCEELKAPSDFNDRTVRGSTYKMAICRECEKVRQQLYYRNRKLIAKLKEKRNG